MLSASRFILESFRFTTPTQQSQTQKVTSICDRSIDGLQVKMNLNRTPICDGSRDGPQGKINVKYDTLFVGEQWIASKDEP